MKTKDFIKMLQEADPSGDSYVRLPCSGAPWFAELKEGYWYGSYQYLEKVDPDKREHAGNLRIVISTQGMKLDIYTLDLDTIIWDENGNLDRIKNRIRYDMTYARNDERIAEYWKYIEEEAAYARSVHEKSLEDWTRRTIDKFFSGGWEVRQPLDKPIGFYNCMTAYGFLGIKKETFCQGECMAVIESGKFYPKKKR